MEKKLKEKVFILIKVQNTNPGKALKIHDIRKE
jgi:hypothetical protein